MQICCKSCDSKDCDGCNIMILTEMLQKGQLNGYMTDNHTIDPRRFIQERKTLTITEATLLSVEEAERLPDHLRKYDCWWWLRSPGDSQPRAAYVHFDGSVDSYGYYVCNDTGCVRPVLILSNLDSSNLKIGDKFEFGGTEFEIISDNLAFCVSDIDYCTFRKNWEAEDANDYEASDVKKFVDEWFQKASADKETSQKEKTPTDVINMSKKIKITGATLLSTEEAQNLPDHLRKYYNCWWLRSPGYYQRYAATILNYGSVFYVGYNVFSDNVAVRLALRISNLESSDLQIGDRFHFGGVEFEIVSDNLAFCVTDIGCCAFRKDWKAANANTYENSDVKRFVDNWFKNAKKCCRKDS